MTEKIKTLFKSPAFYILLFLILFVGLFSSQKEIEKGSASLKGAFEDLFSFSEESIFFFSQKESLEIDSFQLGVTGGDSLLSISSPETVSSQVLGAIADDFDPEEAAQRIEEYVVQPGDSLSIIARKFNVSTNTIRWANEIRGDRIRTGQKLLILPVDGVLHLTEEQDTPRKLANLYNVEVDILPDQIYIGDVLVIPGGEMPEKEQIIRETFVSPDQFIVPARGVITQGLHPFNAIDIANRNGGPIFAVASGTIQRTGYCRIGGNYVRIIHPGNIVTYYGHLSEIYVAPGQGVSQGSVIGSMGNTGQTIGPTGIHLHFEVRGGTNPFARYPVGHRF